MAPRAELQQTPTRQYLYEMPPQLLPQAPPLSLHQRVLDQLPSAKLPPDPEPRTEPVALVVYPHPPLARLPQGPTVLLPYRLLFGPPLLLPILRSLGHHGVRKFLGLI